MASIVILGSTGTIGSALAQRLVDNGEQLLLVGRDPKKLALQAEKLGQPFVVIDFTNSESLEKALNSQAELCGCYTGLVNCCGSLLLKPAHSTSDDEFRQVIETNLFTAFATVRVGGKVLRKQGGSAQ